MRKLFFLPFRRNPSKKAPAGGRGALINPSPYPFGPLDGRRKPSPDENPAVIIKRKVNGPNGMIRSAPLLMDRSKTQIDCSVGNGSHVKVQYKEWESQWNGKTFKGLDFMKMQVLKLVEYNGGIDDEFDVEDEEEAEL